MNKYESVIIVKPEISKEEFDKTIEKFKKLIISFSIKKWVNKSLLCYLTHDFLDISHEHYSKKDVNETRH